MNGSGVCPILERLRPCLHGFWVCYGHESIALIALCCKAVVDFGDRVWRLVTVIRYCQYKLVLQHDVKRQKIPMIALIVVSRSILVLGELD